MRRASPNPFTERSVIVAPRKALKFTAAPNPHRMSKEFVGFFVENKLFHSTFSRQGETQMCSLADPNEAASRFTSATGPRIHIVPARFFGSNSICSSTALFHPVNKIDAVSLYDLAVLTILGRTYNNGASRRFSSIWKMNKLGPGSSLNC